ncbi:peptidase S41 [Calothrix sp. NIES-4101]|nr:peptidase S41 [Calothrix sp. NIES-4101]
MKQWCLKTNKVNSLEVSHPFLSPDGSLLAFIGREEGHPEVYVTSSEGGVAKRLTFLGANTIVVGWSPDSGSILFASNTTQPFRRIYNLYQISPEGGLPERLPWGLANHLSYGRNGGVVIGRNTSDIARWKRYRGGTTGVIWIDPDGMGNFHKLLDLPGNLTAPMWVGERIYFISDHEQIGNLYSCLPNGGDVQKHTHHQDYYVRNATTDGKRIVYHAGAELFCFDPLNQNPVTQKIPVQFYSPQVQRQRKFVDCANYLESYHLHPDGHSTLVTARGKSFWFGNWEGAVTQIGQRDGVRYRCTCWLGNGQGFVTISDAGGEEALEIHSCDPHQPPQRLTGLDLGRTIAMEVSPTADMVALSNHRYELIVVDLTSKQSRILDRSIHHRIGGFSWSPDGKWLAYGFTENAKVSTIKLCSLVDGSTYRLTEPNFWDYAPSFDPDGKFIYFLSYREFNPVYDSLYFDLSFPQGMRPCLISLQKDTRSPFIAVPKPLNDKPPQEKANNLQENTNSKPEDNQTSDLKIDFDNISRRVVGFPVPEGRYGQVIGLKGKVLLTSFSIKGSLENGDGWSDENRNQATLYLLDFEQQKQDIVAEEVNNFKVCQDKETIIYRCQNRLRVCRAAPKSNGKLEDEPVRKTGWLDLNRVKISVIPNQEWQQMFREVWRLQKEHFWVENMSGIDWEQVYQSYRLLLDKVTSRSEFSDLIWELQGELGTSHAYEMGGDYRRSPGYHLGLLGADFRYDPVDDAYRVEHIVQGDSWNERANSPLNTLGTNIQEGDLLLWVGGQRLGKQVSPQELLVHKADLEVTLTFACQDEETYQTITVKTLRDDSKLRYREWVERNRQIVREKTGARVGYLHIPDMGANGYAEFHRYFGVEVQQEALIIDVRYNGGGNVSQLLLEKLARQRIGYCVSRWGQPQPYPIDSLIGPMVGITNELAGSDGDIFSHCFKLMKLGKLIGKRTWGGVIGISSPCHPLVDGSIVTQPEYSCWFQDVGWQVENYGTDPDIEVEITPQDWGEGKDPQLERAIELILQQLQENPVQLPEFSDRVATPVWKQISG